VPADLRPGDPDPVTVASVEGTEPPAGTFAFAQMVEAIAAESHRLSEAVGSLDLDARVPSCPEWSVRDLAHHIGEVQWYWGENVRARNAEERSGAELTAFPEDSDLLAWLGWCTYSLLGALREAGPDAPCWTWWPGPHTAGAVGRHQAQEAAVHRWDAEGVTGASGPLDPELADDGVPEFMEIMVGPDLASLPGAVTLTATDTGASWRVAGAGGERSARVSELRAPASDLVLMLYRRLPVPDTTVEGDPVLVAALLSLADTR
jgi:uncharacterized protein (TIGR03083 family)